MTGTLIQQSGGTILFRQNGSNIQYLLQGASLWVNVSAFPINVTNLNASSSNILTVKLASSMNVSFNLRFVIQYTNYIDFDGQKNTITINNVTPYYGLIDADSSHNINIKNIIMAGTGTTSLQGGCGYVGGGQLSGTISYCSSSGIIGNGIGCGGICGVLYSDVLVVGCYSSGEIRPESGGIIGRYSQGIVRECFSTGKISGYNAGGIVGGTSNGQVIKCFSTGEISGEGAGGIGGSIYMGKIFESFSTGAISGWGSGGLAGYGSQGVTAKNNYSSGAVTGGAASGTFNPPDGIIENVYVANGNWSSSVAQQTLLGVPSQIPGKGEIWYLGTSSAKLSFTVPEIILVEKGPDFLSIKIYGNNLGNTLSILVNNSIAPSSFFLNSDGSLTVIMQASVLIMDVKLFNIYNEQAVYHLSVPIFPTCFPAGTPVLTDQGIINIEKINPKIHTINNKKIVAVTKTITNEKHLVCIEKNALGDNIPNQQTIMSSSHCVVYKNKFIPARNLKNFIENKEDIYKIKYDNEILYNILMETHETMNVNNMIVETLHPENIFAKLYYGNYSKKDIIVDIDDCMEHNKLKNVKKILKK
jgi:hypothetical protein